MTTEQPGASPALSDQLGPMWPERKDNTVGEIFREMQAEADERNARTAFEAWLAKRGTPLHLEQTQAYEAFKAGMTHQACLTVGLLLQAQSEADKNARMKLADNDTDGARQFRAVASHLQALAAEWYGA